MNIFVWGTGRLMGMVVGKMIAIDQIAGFIDNDPGSREYMDKKVYKPEDMLKMDYDAIIVANSFSAEIYRQCVEIGIDTDKMIFAYNNCELKDMNADYSFAERILGKENAEIIKNRYHVVRGVEASGELCLKGTDYEKTGYMDDDYVRAKSFELAVKEIRKRKIKGEVAEVGVFRGEFAQYINFAFPDRKCYLFDTFEGFNAAEALRELKAGNCTEAFVEAYKNTNLQVVLDRMTYLDNVIIKQGFFPDSLDGLEEKFVFVSVDVDFEDSIYECLKYFYPRLAVGGYIFVHDYNNNLLGVEKAIDRYESDEHISLAKFPLSDNCGTLAITK
ncbi:MAG: TylF/MycF family methyltransferase [Lachnospiraceae bacterium]|nr:TylF/MycF family methyltransferase [Lachnospiraceae bacterium]